MTSPLLAVPGGDYNSTHYRLVYLRKSYKNLNRPLIIWSCAAKKHLVKLQLAQNRAARLALHCNQRADINAVHASLYWLRVEERLTASLLLFIRNINVLKIPNSLHSQLTQSSYTHTYPNRHATRGLFTVTKSRTNSR